MNTGNWMIRNMNTLEIECPKMGGIVKTEGGIVKVEGGV